MSFTESLDDIVAGNRNRLLGKRSSWSRVRLKEIAKILNGFPFDSEHFSRTEGTPLLRIRDIVPSRTETFYKGDFDRAFLVEPGEIVVGMDGDFNCAVWAGEPALLNQRVCKITPDELHYSKQFLRYVLPGYLAAINAHTPSLTVKHLSSRTVADIPLPFPPIDEQHRIVSEIEKQFTRLDAGVAGLRRVQANLKRYRAAVLKAACEGKLVPTEAELARQEGRSYESGSQLLDHILAKRRQTWNGKGKYKESVGPNTENLPSLSEGWAWATLPQLGELNRGKSKHRPRDDARLYGGPYPFIQTGDIRKSGGTIREHTQTYSELGLQQSRLWPRATLCITIAANIAETGILTYPACFPDSVVGFVFDGDHVTTRYIEFFLRTAKESLERFAPATAQKNINLNVLQNVAIPLPPLAEQQRIVAEVDRSLSVVEELEGAVNVNLQRATRLRQSILQWAFEGKLIRNEIERADAFATDLPRADQSPATYRKSID